MAKLWQKWLRKQDNRDIYRLAVVAIERLIELEEVSFLIDDCVDQNGHILDDNEVLEEMLYWTDSGNNLLEGDERQ